jgi:hypothetical protein
LPVEFKSFTGTDIDPSVVFWQEVTCGENKRDFFSLKNARTESEGKRGKWGKRQKKKKGRRKKYNLSFAGSIRKI